MGVEAVRQALEHLPRAPGVYLMRDRQGRVIYVGKAKDLRARVGSYARREAAPTWYRHKVEAMVARVARVEFVLTASEKEALLLESTLIKEHRPRYNVDLRDDKSYPYFRLSLQHPFPRLSLVRRPDLDDGAAYFGPFDHVGAARKTLRLLQRVFPLRRCSDRVLASRRRPCLDHEMGRCLAPCAGGVSPEDYARVVAQARRFLEGRGREVARELEEQMRRAAAAERFEEAAAWRDRLFALRRTLERQRVAGTRGEDLDALALHQDAEGLRLAAVCVRGGQVVASRVHELGRAALQPEEAMAQALLMLYRRLTPPPLVLLSHLPRDPALVAEVLAERAGRRVELRLPRRGEKRQILDLARLNAQAPRQVRGDDPQAVLERLQARLHLPRPPRRMECIDVSHLGGRLTVASLVAMKDGRLHKAGYRRYQVITSEGAPDDYAAMREVVARRLGGDRPPPELLLLDGGKGQLAVARAVLAELPPERRPALAAIAKGRGRGPDRVYLPGRKNPLNLPAHDPALHLLMRLRDEAHRFALEYHRLLRHKALTRSVLEEVPGVGPKRRRRLLRAFGSLAALRRASVEDLCGKGGLDRATARRLRAFLSALDTLSAPK